MNSLLSEDRRPSFEPPRQTPVVQPLPSGPQRGSVPVVDERLHDRRDRTEYPNRQDPRENLTQTSELP